MMHCNKCSADLHYECIALRKEDDPDNPGIVLFSCCCIGKSIEPTIISSTGKEYRDEDDVERGNGGRMLKEGENMRDVESTGRKRAAQAAPINALMPCEWQGLKSAGGGVFPIIGCRDSTQVDRHHGPDKGTLNNAVGTNLHRICKTCITEGMRLLTEDLTWLPVENLRVGDRLVGFSENLKHGENTFEPAVVESIEKVIEPCYRLTMADGTTMVVSHNHQWVGSRPNDKHAKWLTTEKMLGKRSKANYTLKRLVKPWEPDLSYDAGWLAGFLDGEGALTGYTLSVAQSDKDSNRIVTDKMYEEIYSRATKVTETYRPAAGNNSEIWWLRLTNLGEILSLLGTVRPIRLLDKVANFLYAPANGREKGKSPIPVSDRVDVVGIEYVGEQEVYSVQTSSSTYIVEGYLSHNCHNRWHTLNDPMYPSKRPAKGAPFLPLSGDVIPHDPLTKATLKEQFDNEVFWATPKASRAVEEKEQENDSAVARGLAEGTRSSDGNVDRPSEPESGLLL